MKTERPNTAKWLLVGLGAVFLVIWIVDAILRFFG